MQEELARLLAEALIACYEETVERWAKVRQLPSDGSESAPPRCHADVANVKGRRVFTMARAEWERPREREGELVEMDLTRTRDDGVGEPAAVIACLAAECSVQTGRIEVWPYNKNDQPGLLNLQEYLVLEDLTRRVKLPVFAERASTQDSPKLRKYLRGHVFIVRDRSEKGWREAKAQARERIMFMVTRH
jgi:hypothetical protein